MSELQQKVLSGVIIAIVIGGLIFLVTTVERRKYDITLTDGTTIVAKDYWYPNDGVITIKTCQDGTLTIPITKLDVIKRKVEKK